MAHILVVEDDLHISRVVALWLKRNGHEVATIADGAIALQTIRVSPPDLLITDVNLPGMDGLDLIQAIRSESLIDREIIVLTSRCDQSEIEARAQKLRASVHPKPFSPAHLMQTVEKALSDGSDADTPRFNVQTGAGV